MSMGNRKRGKRNTKEMRGSLKLSVNDEEIQGRLHCCPESERGNGNGREKTKRLLYSQC